MQINRIGTIANKFISFKDNFFTIEKRGKYFNLSKISTDNAEKLGKEPILEYIDSGKKYEFPMIYDGKYYTTSALKETTKYRIIYKDTGKYENNGEEQTINSVRLSKIATIADRINNNLPLEQAISKGEAEGKVFVNTYDIPKDEPAILIIDHINKEEDIITAIPDNVQGVIVSSSDMDVLSHAGNLTRNRIRSMCIVYDEDKYNDLKNKAGKYITVNNENGILKYRETKPNKLKAKNVEKVAAPKLENVERLLNFDELTPQNCGNKGYRISVMQRLAREGILKHITVPNGFVIPEGYINKYKEYINVKDKEEWKKGITEGIYTQDTENKIKELGLPRQSLIIRSNFNTEDMGSFSSAGIYESECASISGSIIDEAVFDIVRYSMEESELAKKVHKQYGITDKDIQPSVIVQEQIRSDYEYTIYSDDGDNNLIIELSDSNLGYLKPSSALIRYNKETKELNLERKQSPFAEYTVDENGKIISQIHIKEKIEENWDILKPLLGTITSGALALEKFFKKPQDIEGGIKDGKVYFWQTRDIVAKAAKKI